MTDIAQLRADRADRMLALIDGAAFAEVTAAVDQEAAAWAAAPDQPADPGRNTCQLFSAGCAALRQVFADMKAQAEAELNPGQ